MPPPNAAPGGTRQGRSQPQGRGRAGFAFTIQKGRKVTLAAFSGKPVLLNLWATWCAPCVKEMPTLDALAVREGTCRCCGQPGPGGGQGRALLRRSKFRKLQPWHDPETAFSLQLGVNLPTTILYDLSGREVWRRQGDTDWTGDAAAKLIAEAG